MSPDAQAEMLANRLKKKAKKLKGWAKRRGLFAYRLYDRDIPEIPVVVDRYNDHLHMAVFWKDHLDGKRVAIWRDAAREALEATDIAVKIRKKQKEGAQYERQEREGERFVVEEAGLKFWVELFGHLDTGLFLDHRDTRARVKKESAKKRVLNLYGYTGSFTVYAAAGDASAVTHVDLSKRYCGWTEENLALNGLSAEVVALDTRRFLAEAKAEGREFDLVVVDPPTFSRSKRMQGSFDVVRDHAALLGEVCDVLADGGAIYFSTNARGFNLDDEVAARFDFAERCEVIPQDFQGRHAHRLWKLATIE